MGQTIDVGISLVVVECCACGTQYAISQSLHALAKNRREAKTLYCPVGHGWSYSGKSKDEEINDLKLRLQQKDNAIAEERKQREKLEKRIQKGICPYCKRTFGNLARHMETQHREAPCAH